MTKEISKEAMIALAEIQCTVEEFSAALGVSKPTVIKRVKEVFNVDSFGEFIERHGGQGKISLRRSMWKNALKGNIVMQIFLAKNHLGMSDKVEATHQNPDGTPLSYSIEIIDGSNKTPND